eukprot:347770-Hanusia_phi.AAC.1
MECASLSVTARVSLECQWQPGHRDGPVGHQCRIISDPIGLGPADRIQLVTCRQETSENSEMMMPWRPRSDTVTPSLTVAADSVSTQCHRVGHPGLRHTRPGVRPSSRVHFIIKSGAGNSGSVRTPCHTDPAACPSMVQPPGSLYCPAY